MKKKLAVIAMAAALTVGTSMTAFAAPNPTGGNSDVYVGVTQTTPTNVSVTVPTSLAIAVVDDGTSIQTLMGNYMVKGDGSLINSGDASQGIKEQRVSFVNNGVAAKITTAKVVNSYGSAWTLADDTTTKKEMSMKFNGVGTGTIAPDNHAIITLNDFSLPANQTTHMKAEVKAGGVVGDYDKIEESAKSFVVEWNIVPQ